MVKMQSLASLLIYLFLALSTAVDAIPTISQVGSKFFTSDGKQWYAKGVAYQLTEDDPLVSTSQCQLDADLMAQLGANAIRVYHVDASANHDGCMNAFAAKGIYAFIDMDSFKTYIRYDTTPSWTQNKSDSYRAVMDNFQQYDNCAGFFVGNEVLNTAVDAGSAPYLLAAAADLKAYRDARGYRKIPIGYSATDTAVLRPMLQDYVVCRPNETERLDFYSLNSYEWCGASATYETSGYSQLQASAENYPVPIFFSEDGCNTVPPRTFDDQAAIFGPQMVNTWSGAIIYEWIQELNNYGLISYGPQQAADVNAGTTVIQGFVRGGTPTPVQPDFGNLQSQWAAITPTGVHSSQYAATMKTTAPECPAFTAGSWTVDPSAALPTIGAEGVSSGMPSGVPRGSITASTTLVSQSSSISHAYSSTVSPSGSTTGSAGAAASSGAAGKTNPIPIASGDLGLTGMVVALLAVGAGMVILL